MIRFIVVLGVFFLFSASGFSAVPTDRAIKGAINRAVLASEVFGCDELLNHTSFKVQELQVEMKESNVFSATILLQSLKDQSVFAVAAVEGQLITEAGKLQANLNSTTIQSLIYQNGEESLDSFIRSPRREKIDDVRDPVSGWYASMVRSHLERALKALGLQNVKVTLEQVKPTNQEELIEQRQKEEAAIFRAAAAEVREETRGQNLGREGFMSAVNRRIEQKNNYRSGYNAWTNSHEPMGSRPSMYLSVEYGGPTALVDGVDSLLRRMRHYRGILIR